jgi:kynurenine formamidase
VKRLIELSHVLEDGMITYPGLPALEIGDHLTREASRARYAPGTEFHIARVSMVANTGTYLDTPAHRFAGRPDLAQVGLEKLVDLEGLVIDAKARAIGRSDHHVRGRAVLFRTGWDRHWRTDRYAVEAPFVTRDAAVWLATSGAALVGIDSVNIDDIADVSRPAHTILLEAGIPIVEHMRGLEQLPASDFRFHAAPPLVRGMGTFPVRAYAIVGA